LNGNDLNEVCGPIVCVQIRHFLAAVPGDLPHLAPRHSMAAEPGVEKMPVRVKNDATGAAFLFVDSDTSQRAVKMLLDNALCHGRVFTRIAIKDD
jgi:hypothetical protein